MLRPAVKICGLAIALVVGTAATVDAQAEALTIELNRLVQDGEGCRFDLIIENALDIGFARFSADLVFFDHSGVVSARAAAHFGRLRPNKTHLRSFVLSSLNCADVGRVLLNEVTACQHTAETEFDCMDAIEVRHRGGVDLIK